jgi:hypothetical protein
MQVSTSMDPKTSKLVDVHRQKTHGMRLGTPEVDLLDLVDAKPDLRLPRLQEKMSFITREQNQMLDSYLQQLSRVDREKRDGDVGSWSKAEVVANDVENNALCREIDSILEKRKETYPDLHAQEKERRLREEAQHEAERERALRDKELQEEMKRKKKELLAKRAGPRDRVAAKLKMLKQDKHEHEQFKERVDEYTKEESIKRKEKLSRYIQSVNLEEEHRHRRLAKINQLAEVEQKKRESALQSKQELEHRNLSHAAEHAHFTINRKHITESERISRNLQRIQQWRFHAWLTMCAFLSRTVVLRTSMDSRKEERRIARRKIASLLMLQKVAMIWKFKLRPSKEKSSLAILRRSMQRFSWTFRARKKNKSADIILYAAKNVTHDAIVSIIHRFKQRVVTLQRFWRHYRVLWYTRNFIWRQQVLLFIQKEFLEDVRKYRHRMQLKNDLLQEESKGKSRRGKSRKGKKKPSKDLLPTEGEGSSAADGDDGGVGMPLSHGMFGAPQPPCYNVRVMRRVIYFALRARILNYEQERLDWLADKELYDVEMMRYTQQLKERKTMMRRLGSQTAVDVSDLEQPTLRPRPILSMLASEELLKLMVKDLKRLQKESTHTMDNETDWKDVKTELVLDHLLPIESEDSGEPENSNSRGSHANGDNEQEGADNENGNEDDLDTSTRQSEGEM